MARKQSILLTIAGVLFVLPTVAIALTTAHRDRDPSAPSAATAMAPGDHQHHQHHQHPQPPQSPSTPNGHEGHEGHEGHGQTTQGNQNRAQNQVSLRTLGTVAPGQPIAIELAIAGADGQPITAFETFQEKQLHLIVVRDDLGEFIHAHPAHQGDGVFTLDLTVPTAGNYTLFADYKPAGQAEQVSALALAVPGSAPTPPTVQGDRTRQTNNTQVDLAIAPAPQVGQPTTLTFNLKDTNGQPATDLRPYLGERGHLVIVRQGEPRDRSAYLHAHALDNTPPHQVSFHTQFPRAGTYRAWGQFQRGDRLITADFWIEVP
jgi:protocatechuate 3,4-dioxygenase beta subunit